MGLFLAMALAIWGIGAVMKAPLRLRQGLIAVLWAGFALGAWALPPEAGLRQVVGGSVAPWALLGGGVALVGLSGWAGPAAGPGCGGAGKGGCGKPCAGGQL